MPAAVDSQLLIMKGKILDASDGDYVLQVEAKGTSVEDSEIRGSTIAAKKYSVKEKKKKIAELELKREYQYPASFRYGTIGVVGHSGTAKCLLVDPPVEGVPDSKRVRLLNRLQFIFNWISYLGARSPFTASFATRLLSLEALTNPFELDQIPLTDGNGIPYEMYQMGTSGLELRLFSRLSHVTDGLAVGTIIRLQNGSLLFLGIQGKLYEYVAMQDFDTILGYRYESGSVQKRLRCVLPIGQARQLRLLVPEIRTEESGGYVRFYASGLLQYAAGGTVFGIVSLEE